MQPSASKASLLLNCAWAFNNPIVPPAIPTEAMRWGNGVHAVLESSIRAGIPPKVSLAAVPKIAKQCEVDEKELRAKAGDAYKELLRWLDGGNAWDLKLLPAPKGAIVVERAVAYNVVDGSARFCAPVDEHHVYPDVTGDEHPGTTDLAIKLAAYGTRIPPRYRKAVIILDHKTGMSVDMPRESAQLKSLALSFVRLWGGNRAILALLHAPRDSVPVVFADELSLSDLDEYAALLRAAWARIGDGSLRPHGGCDWCPGISVCPAHGGSLALLADSLGPPGAQEPLVTEAKKKLRESVGMVAARPQIDLTTSEGLGTAHMLVQMIRAVDGELSERIRAALREDGFDDRGNSVRFAVRPDGKIALLHRSQRENLSLASIKRNLSAGEAAKIEKLLRDKGCVEELPREELRAVDDR